MSKASISNKSLILRIIILMLFLSVTVLFISTEYLKKTAVDNLASDDIKKTAQLVFETMNTRMQEGWTKGDLEKIIDRLKKEVDLIYFGNSKQLCDDSESKFKEGDKITITAEIKRPAWCVDAML